MILVLAGTSDAAEIARELDRTGLPVLASTATEYGAAALQRRAPRVPVIFGVLDEEGITRLLAERSVSTVVDATHPFAQEVTGNAARAARSRGVRYLRWERPEEELPASPFVLRAGDFEAAADLAAEMGRSVFLATGSRTLPLFVRRLSPLGLRITVRVLPDAVVIEQCLALGLDPEQIVAAKGPFSCQVNREMFRSSGAEVVVSKESGAGGGVRAKLEAAEDLEIPLILISRPPRASGAVSDIDTLLQKLPGNRVAVRS